MVNFDLGQMLRILSQKANIFPSQRLVLTLLHGHRAKVSTLIALASVDMIWVGQLIMIYAFALTNMGKTSMDLQWPRRNHRSRNCPTSADGMGLVEQCPGQAAVEGDTEVSPLPVRMHEQGCLSNGRGLPRDS